MCPKWKMLRKNKYIGNFCGHPMVEYIEKDPLCKFDVDLIVVEISVVQHLVDDFINDNNK